MLINLPLLLNHRKVLLLKMMAKFGMTGAIFTFDWYKVTCLKDQYPYSYVSVLTY